MRKLLLSLGLMAVLAQSVLGFGPSEWVYSDYPWAYDSKSGDWYWFNTADTQWIANMGNSQWSRLSQSAMASGWVFYQNPFAYAQGNSAWHYINEADTQWVVNMRTGAWSRFGQDPIPVGMVRIPGGTNAGTNSLGGGGIYGNGLIRRSSRQQTTAILSMAQICARPQRVHSPRCTLCWAPQYSRRYEPAAPV